MRSKTAMMAAVAAVAALVTTPARAREVGGTGALCTPKDASSDTFLYHHNAALNTDLTASRSIACGTLRLTTSSPRQVSIDYKDDSTTSAVGCTVYVDSWTGERIWSQSFDNAPVTLRGTGGFGATIPSSAVGYVQISCTFPPRTQAGSQPHLYCSGLYGFSLR